MKVMITGGAGFIGSNVVRRHLDRGDSVIILDNLSRKGCADNVEWLSEHARGRLQVVEGDVRSCSDIQSTLCKDTAIVYHLAGQVAVTCSVQDPKTDFQSNVLGTFNLLESVRQCCPDAAVVYASTNKVYGQLRDIPIVEDVSRYRYVRHEYGVSEKTPLDFYTPYGCSKGSGDQYVCDYARTYDLRTVVFRQSCIYGPRQFGVEDQGWLAHFCIAIKHNKTISIYGDGKQVRDILWVDDLLDAYDSAIENMDRVSGCVFNIGGGVGNSMSVWAEFEPLIKRISGREARAQMMPWRLGDQRIYVSDIRKACDVLNWSPKTSIECGVSQLWNWVNENKSL